MQRLQSSITYNYLTPPIFYLTVVFLLFTICYYKFFLHAKIASSITYNYLTPPIF